MNSGRKRLCLASGLMRHASACSGGIHTTSPDRISSTGSPQRCTRPVPGRHDQDLAVRMRVPGGTRARSKGHISGLTFSSFPVSNRGSTRTEPVKYSAGPSRLILIRPGQAMSRPVQRSNDHICVGATVGILKMGIPRRNFLQNFSFNFDAKQVHVSHRLMAVTCPRIRI